MIPRFIRAVTAAALSLVLTGQSFAYDPARAPGYGSPDMYRPNMDGVILRGNSSSGLANGLSVKLPDAAAVARTFVDMAADRPSVASFGAKCDGVADDTVAFQIAGLRGKQFSVPLGVCRVASFVMSSTSGSAISAFIGAGVGLTTLKLITPAGVDAIQVNGPGGYNPVASNWTAVLRDMTIDAVGNTAMTGRAIACTNAAGLVIERVLFRGVPNFASQKDCIFMVALDVKGFDLKAATGNAFYIDGGSFFADRLFYQSTTPGGYNFDPEAYIKVKQTFGVFLGGGIISHARRGLYVSTPGGSFAEYSTIGPIQFDQISLNAIDLEANGGVIRGWQFNHTWASTAFNGISMRATNGGVIDTPELNHVRALNSMNANLVVSGVTNLRIIGGDLSGAGYVFTGTCSLSSADSSVTITANFEFNTVMGSRPIVVDGQTYTIRNIISGTKAGLVPPQAGVPDKTGVPCSITSDTQVNVNLTGATTDVTILGTKIGKARYAPGSPNFGVFIDQNVDRVTMADNDLSGVPQPIFWNRTTPMTEAVFTGNRGVDTKQTTIASAATLPLTFARSFTLTGTTTVTAISGPAWPGRQFTAIPTAVVTFTAGNNIGNSFTTVAGQPFTAVLNEGRWFLR